MGWIEKGSRALAIAGLLLLLVYAFGTLVDGLTRTFLSLSVDFVRDLSQPYIAAALSCCFPYAFVIRSNIFIMLLEPLIPRRASSLMAGFSWLVTLLVIGAFAYQFFVYANGLQQAGETTAVYQVPTAPFWYVVAFNFALTTVLHALNYRDWMASRAAGSEGPAA